MMRLVLIVLLYVVSIGAQAVSLTVDENGQLLGATGVNVSGTLYNVEFLDGSCIDVFYGCDEQSDFAFSTEKAAEDAAVALFDQVLRGGQFDTMPSLTRGCESAFSCLLATPYELNLLPSNSFIRAVVADNLAIIDEFIALEFPYSLDDDLSAFATQTYVRWTPVSAVPLPAAFPLFAAALAGLGVVRRRKLTVQFAA